MRLLIAQLSDIHLQHSTDPILTRIDALAAAIASCDPSANGCLMLYCGDIAFSGSDEQYSHALDLILALREQLSSRLPAICIYHEAFIPGNHDCDFQGMIEARTLLTQSLLQNNPKRVTTDVLEVCTSVQRGFFALLEALDVPVQVGERLAYSTSFVVEGKRVVVNCLNSAWLSKLKEAQGELFIPIEHLMSRSAGDEFVITAMHHPYNWFEHTNARDLRTAIEGNADLVLTGHEHEYGNRDIRNEKGERSIYIEASALQEHMHPQRSAFQAVCIDYANAKQRIIRYEFEDGKYVPAGDVHAWQPLQSTRFKTQNGFILQGAFQAYLDDLGIVLTHPTVPEVRRGDLFTYPDLRRRTEDHKAPIQSIRGESLADIVNEAAEIVVVGNEVSGKSTLTKQLYEDLLGVGHVPVLIRCSDGSSWNAESCLRRVEDAFEQQYGPSRLNEYRQLPRELRTVIFDDFHQFKCKRSALDSTLRSIGAFAGHVVFVSSELDQQLADVVHRRVAVEQGSAIQHYSILPFGHLRRNELAERWLSLDAALTGDSEAFAKALIRAEKMMSTAVGRNFIPAYPVFVLPMLQALAHDEQVNVGASAYGYFYESLIRRALATGGSKERLDLHIGFLSHLAYKLFHEEATEINEESMMKLLIDFRKKKLVELHFSNTMEALLKSGIVVRSDDRIQFKYSYIEYYFTALALRESLGEDETRYAIAKLADTLHEERSANVMLFLVHLTKDEFVIELLLSRARAVFAEVEPCGLTPAEALSEGMEALPSSDSFQDGDARAFRREALAALDQRADAEQGTAIAKVPPLAEQESLEDAYQQADAYVRRISVAFKTLQILGQVAVNFPGTMEGDTKKRIVGEAAALGLRALASMFELIHERVTDFVQLAVLKIQTEFPMLSDEEVQERAKESAAALPRIVAYGVIRRIAHAVGSPHLGPVYAQLVPESADPAMRLVYAALLLDQSDGFPEEFVGTLCGALQKNPLATSILVSIVVHHMHVFEVRFDRKQRMCNLLGIAYKPLQGTKPRALLVRGR